MKRKLMVVLGFLMLLSGIWGGSYVFYEYAQWNWTGFPTIATTFIWSFIGVIMIIINLCPENRNKVT
jgi:hypothetical protein